MPKEFKPKQSTVGKVEPTVSSRTTLNVGDTVRFKNQDEVVEKVNDDGSIDIRLKDDTVQQRVGLGDGAHEYTVVKK